MALESNMIPRLSPSRVPSLATGASSLDNSSPSTPPEFTMPSGLPSKRKIELFEGGEWAASDFSKYARRA